jgi:xanthine dehydrogenase accessory factor
MLVFTDTVHGTIGGGHLEFDAIAQARSRLSGTSGEEVLRYALGPSLGQCCGGVAHLRFERLRASDIPALERRFQAERAPLALFGGGHVGRAIAAALAPVARRVIATRYQQDRAMDPAALAAVFAGADPRLAVATAPGLAAALAQAAGDGAPIAVAGSLFLVGEARTLVLGAPTDPMLVTDPPAR